MVSTNLLGAELCSNSAKRWFSLRMIWGFWGAGFRTSWQSSVRPKTLLRCLEKWSRKRRVASPQNSCRAERNPGPRKPQIRNVQIRNLALPWFVWKGAATKQESVKKVLFTEKQGRYSVNKCIGKELYRKGKALKRSSPRLQEWRSSALIRFPNLDAYLSVGVLGNENNPKVFLHKVLPHLGRPDPNPGRSRPLPCLKQQKKATCIEFLSRISRCLGPWCPQEYPHPELCLGCFSVPDVCCLSRARRWSQYCGKFGGIFGGFFGPTDSQNEGLKHSGEFRSIYRKTFRRGCSFFAYSWKLPAYSGALLLTVDNFSIFAYNWNFFTYIANFTCLFCLQCDFASNQCLKGLQAKKLNCKQKRSNCK